MFSKITKIFTRFFQPPTLQEEITRLDSQYNLANPVLRLSLWLELLERHLDHGFDQSLLLIQSLHMRPDGIAILADCIADCNAQLSQMTSLESVRFQLDAAHSERAHHASLVLGAYAVRDVQNFVVRSQYLCQYLAPLWDQPKTVRAEAMINTTLNELEQTTRDLLSCLRQ